MCGKLFSALVNLKLLYGFTVTSILWWNSFFLFMSVSSRTYSRMQCVSTVVWLSAWNANKTEQLRCAAIFMGEEMRWDDRDMFVWIMRRHKNNEWELWTVAHPEVTWSSVCTQSVVIHYRVLILNANATIELRMDGLYQPTIGTMLWWPLTRYSTPPKLSHTHSIRWRKVIILSYFNQRLINI